MAILLNLVKCCYRRHEPCRQQRYGDSSCCAGSARVDATRRVAGDVRFTVQLLKTSLHIYSRVNENNDVIDVICVNITALGR